jgi:formate-dependent nitrite reductase membrane component NrfD
MRWAFALVALVIVVYVGIAVSGIVQCIVNNTKCDPDNRLIDLLATALAAALALYTGLNKK